MLAGDPSAGVFFMKPDTFSRPIHSFFPLARFPPLNDSIFSQVCEEYSTRLPSVSLHYLHSRVIVMPPPWNPGFFPTFGRPPFACPFATPPERGFAALKGASLLIPFSLSRY